MGLEGSGVWSSELVGFERRVVKGAEGSVSLSMKLEMVFFFCKR